MSSTGQNIRKFLGRKPFVPFRFVLTSGEHRDVTDARSAALLKSEVFVALPDGERGTHVPFVRVASIETLGNRRGRRME